MHEGMFNSKQESSRRHEGGVRQQILLAFSFLRIFNVSVNNHFKFDFHSRRNLNGKEYSIFLACSVSNTDTTLRARFKQIEIDSRYNNFLHSLFFSRKFWVTSSGFDLRAKTTWGQLNDLKSDSCDVGLQWYCALTVN